GRLRRRDARDRRRGGGRARAREAGASGHGRRPPGRGQGGQARGRALPLRGPSGPLGRARPRGRGGAEGSLMIDLRSDTQTRPTPEMRAAIAAAEVGDEQKREDPTVNELERRAAELLGQEESVFVPTATMANEIALRTLGEPGDEVIAEENSHIFLAELGGPAVHAGLMTRPLRCTAGRFTPEQIRDTVPLTGGTPRAPKKIVSAGDTTNASAR